MTIDLAQKDWRTVTNALETAARMALVQGRQRESASLYAVQELISAQLVDQGTEECQKGERDGTNG